MAACMRMPMNLPDYHKTLLKTWPWVEFHASVRVYRFLCWFSHHFLSLFETVPCFFWFFYSYHLCLLYAMLFHTVVTYSLIYCVLYIYYTPLHYILIVPIQPPPPFSTTGHIHRAIVQYIPYVRNTMTIPRGPGRRCTVCLCIYILYIYMYYILYTIYIIYIHTKYIIYVLYYLYLIYFI